MAEESIPPFPGIEALTRFPTAAECPTRMPRMEDLTIPGFGSTPSMPTMSPFNSSPGLSDAIPVAYEPAADAGAIPLLEQTGPVSVGPGAEKEALLLGLGLPKLSFRQHDDLAKSKKYTMEQSIKHVLMKQTVAHQANQQKVAMYAQALSLMARVYIGSISFEVREETIKNSFSPFGPIKSINMSWDPVTGHHKGFAFLEYDVPEAALLGQEQMNGVLMGGRNLKVGRPSNMPQAQPIIESIVQEAKEYHRVYVASVHPDLSESDLKSVFEAFGNVIACQLAKHNVQGKTHRGYGYIEFNNPKSAVDAVASMNLFDLGGQYLRVGKAITPPQAQSYIVPTAAANMPTASAVAAAAITAKIQAMEANASSSPVSGIGLSTQPAIMVGNPNDNLSDRDHASNAAMESGNAIFSVPPPGLAIPGGLSNSRGVSPKSGGGSPARGFGGFADNVPPPSVVPSSTPNFVSPLGAASNIPVPEMPQGKRASFGTSSSKKKKKKKGNIDALLDIKNPKSTDVDAQKLVGHETALRLTTSGSLSDKLKKIAEGEESTTLAAQEEMKIKGGEARNVLMHKLMRAASESCVLVLKNMVGPEDVDEYLQEEVEQECNSFGKVVQVVIYQEKQGEAADAPTVVKIFVKYSLPTAEENEKVFAMNRWMEENGEVENARKSLDGRYFAGRQITAEVYDQHLFDHNDLSL